MALFLFKNLDKSESIVFAIIHLLWCNSNWVWFWVFNLKIKNKNLGWVQCLIFMS